MSNKKSKKKMSDTERFLAAHDKYQTEESALLRRLGMSKKLVITFPSKKKMPFMSRLAVRILARQGAVLDTQFKFEK